MPLFPLPPDLCRVVLTGAESTGKTTLAKRLADHYNTVWLPEYVRFYVKEYADESGRTTYDDIPRIAEGYLEQERQLLPHAHRVAIYDTDLISNYLYSCHFFERCPAWIEQASYDRAGDLYLLAGDDIPWEDDPGQRGSPEIRAALQIQFREELERRGLPYITLTGAIKSRLHTAISAIDALL